MVLYSLGWTAALVVSAPWWLWKLAFTEKYREGLRERLGLVPARLFSPHDTRPVVWIHAVSVGEVIAVGGLVSELGVRAPEYRVVVSTTTRTGQRIARERFGAAQVFYYPLDFAFAVRRYLRRVQPELLVLVETEFWPRMLKECRSARVPVAVVNARISDRSYPKYLRLKWLWRRILRGFSLVLAQTDEDRRRLVSIGAPPDRVEVGGNLKYDVRAPAAIPILELLRAALPAGAPLLVSGSTLEGEERVLLEAWPSLTATISEARMVLAPRHPERFGAVAALLERSGIPWSRRSSWPEASRSSLVPASILLLDSIGELAAVYGLASAAFIGGSLVAAGGHSPLEPAQFGVPAVMGPHYENFRGVVDKMLAKDAIRIVDPGRLNATLIELLQGGLEARQIGERARLVFEAESGATGRTVDALLSILRGVAS